MRKQILSLICVVVIGGALTLITLYRPGLETVAADRVSALEPATVTIIRLKRPKKATIVIERVGENWILTSPVKGPANALRARALAALVAAPVVRGYAREDLSLVASGLAPPRFELELNDLQLDLGITEPLEGLRYVATGQKIHLVVDRIAHHLGATPTGFRSPSLLGATPKVRSLRFKDLTVERSETELKWHPESAAKSADQVVTLLSLWESATAFLVEPFNLSLRWDTPIHVRTDAEKDIRFLVARTPKNVIFGRQDLNVQYRLSADRGVKLLSITP